MPGCLSSKGKGTTGKKFIFWRAVAVAAGTAALVLLTLIFGVQVWAGGETPPAQVIVPENEILPHGAGIINKELGKRIPSESPKARPELKKENPVPPEKNRAPAAPDGATRPQVALAHLPTTDH
jgi:hypothetical protein